jgi:hypothetical protein
LYGFYGFDLTNNAKKKYTSENDPLQAQITMREFQFFESIIEKIYLYRKVRKCHFASANTVCGRRGVSRGATASTFNTFSGRVIHKTFSVDNLFKAKYNNCCKNITG